MVYVHDVYAYIEFDFKSVTLSNPSKRLIKVDFIETLQFYHAAVDYGS